MKCRDFYVDLDLKETSPLLERHSATWLADFERRYAKCQPDQRPVDVSTLYSMAPTYQVDFRNTALWGSSSTVLYLVRDRLERSISHHHHDTVLGLTDETVSGALSQESPFVRNSLYSEQVAQWLEHVAPTQLFVINFEGYVKNRQETMQAICEITGVSAAGVEEIDSTKKFNETTGRPTPRGIVQAAVQSSAYRAVRRRIPVRYRQIAKRVLSPSAPGREPISNDDNFDHLDALFRSDEGNLRSMLPSESFLGF